MGDYEIYAEIVTALLDAYGGVGELMLFVGGGGKRGSRIKWR